VAHPSTPPRPLTAERAARALRRHGARGTARIAARRVGRRFYAHERHLWYELDPRGERPRRELPEGFAIRQARDADLSAIAALPEADSVPAMQRWRAHGDELWMVASARGEVAFACWIFRKRAPVAAAVGGWIDLPANVVCLEDSLTAAAFRGRGIAPGAWCELADRLLDDGVEMILTKVEDWNEPSRRAVAKAGFSETATMVLDRRWGRSRVTVAPVGDGRTGLLLATLIEA
jgi:RimJ/RimL family protein N-acetyltransferase